MFRLALYAHLDPSSSLERAGDLCLWGLRTVAGKGRFATINGTRFIYRPDHFSCLFDPIVKLAALILTAFAPFGLLLKGVALFHPDTRRTYQKWSAPTIYTDDDGQNFRTAFSPDNVKESVEKHRLYYYGCKRTYCPLFDQQWLDGHRAG